MAEFDEDIKLGQSNNLLSGVVTTGGLYGAAKVARKGLSQLVVGAGGLRMDNNPKGYYRQGANKVKVLVNTLLHRQGQDIIELITKAQEAYKSPTGNHYNAYTDALDAINRKTPEQFKFGQLLPDGSRDYSKINPKDGKIHKAISNKDTLAKLNGQRSVGSVLKKANLVAEKTRPLNFGDWGNESRFNRLYRHEELKNSLVKKVGGVKLNQQDIAAFNKHGLSKPINTQANRIFSGNHTDILDKWGIGKQEKISWSKITHGGDKIQLTKSVTNSHMYQMQKHVTERLKGAYPAKKLIKEYSNEYVKKINLQDSFLKEFSPTKKFHRMDNVDDAAKHLLKNYKVKSGNIYINFSPGLKPNYLLGGVNANVGMGLNKAGKVVHDLLVTDLYDVTGSGIQKGQHVTYHHSGVNAPKPRAYISTRSKLIKDVKSGNFSKAGAMFKKGVKKVAHREYKDKARLAKSAMQLINKIPKKGKVGLAAAGAASILGLAMDKFGEPEDLT